jgi:hypothetical protein
VVTLDRRHFRAVRRRHVEIIHAPSVRQGEVQRRNRRRVARRPVVMVHPSGAPRAFVPVGCPGR